MQYASKGTLLKKSISSTLTTVAQVFSVKAPKGKVNTFDGTTLDQSGVGTVKLPTGYSDGGTMTAELFFDPGLASHKALYAEIVAPITYVSSALAVPAYTIVWSDSQNGGPTSWPFSGWPSLEVTAALGDGLKATFEVELDGIVTYP
jgi:hypothetical protein